MQCCNNYTENDLAMEETLQTNFERCCRLCAEEQDVTLMIFSKEAEAMLLQNKLHKYLLIEVDEDDKLPKNICIQCCSKLQTVCDFIDTAHKAQELLLHRSLVLEQEELHHSITPIIQDVKTEVHSDVQSDIEDDENKCTEMEVSVDPMMVLQNCEEPMSPSGDDSSSVLEDVTYLHDVDAENVTIKLIKKSDKSHSSNDDKRDVKPFPCITCKRSFYTDLALKNHSWVHINEPKVDELYKCKTCQKCFDFRNDFITHLREHKSSGICQLCGRVFRSERTYIAHISVHLPSNKSFTCNICGRSYNTWGSLKTHSITHSTERPYKCHYCKKTFKRNQDLKFHINQHTGAKPYKCPFCEKCFASSGNCYSHRNRMHPGRCVEGHIVRRWNSSTREKIQPHPVESKLSLIEVKGIYKYQCQLCDHTFMKRDNFTYHMYQHTGEKPFQCSFCTEKFVTRRGLLLHHDKEHPTKNRPLALLSKNVLLK